MLAFLIESNQLSKFLVFLNSFAGMSDSIFTLSIFAHSLY